MARRRLDTLLTERGLAPTRSAAATSVRAGLVRIGRDGERAAKPGQLVAEEAELTLEQGRRYVSRGGNKLEAALDALAVDPAGRDCLDVGASTGGFTDCLLRHGAARVAAVDVGRGQLDWGLRNDERVVLLEGINARELRPGQLPFEPSLATIDVSFISLTRVLAGVGECIAGDGSILAMVKPQFELGPERVGRGGVVRDPGERAAAVAAVAAFAEEAGWPAAGAARAGLPGPKGNVEIFLHLRREGAGLAAHEEAIGRAAG
jgi:23S rRNA (cytidine1920-2'-O)/16S rRNA (cytidine1409-2'-O)-methyltransferase